MASFKNFETLSTANYQAHATGAVVFAATSSAEVISVEIHNVTAVPQWVKLFYPVNGSLGANSGSFERLSETIAAGATLEYKRTPIPMQSGEALYAIAANAGSVNLSVIGRVQ